MFPVLSWLTLKLPVWSHPLSHALEQSTSFPKFAASRLHSYLQQRPRGRHNTHHSLSAKVAKATVQRRAPRLQYVPFLLFSPLSDLLEAQLHLGRRREWDKGHGNKIHTPFIPNIMNICKKKTKKNRNSNVIGFVPLIICQSYWPWN